jgi:hypothetical protein
MEFLPYLVWIYRHKKMMVNHVMRDRVRISGTCGLGKMKC